MESGKQFARHVFSVSDATGHTCEMVVRAALTQFKRAEITLETFANVRTPGQIDEVMEAAQAVNGVVIYTFVSPSLRQHISKEGRARGIPTVDIMGPVLTRLSDLLEISPLARPGLFRQLDSDYFRRMEALDFTLEHDDGRGLETLGRAEIVLVGVSRTSKTPVSIYLAYRGWKVANVPLIRDEPLPPALAEVEAGRIVALIIQPTRLEAVRRERMRRQNIPDAGGYADRDLVRREVSAAGRQFDELGYAQVDVTFKSIEETATEVVRLIYAATGNKKGVSPLE